MFANNSFFKIQSINTAKGWLYFSILGQTDLAEFDSAKSQTNPNFCQFFHFFLQSQTKENQIPLSLRGI